MLLLLLSQGRCNLVEEDRTVLSADLGVDWWRVQFVRAVQSVGQYGSHCICNLPIQCQTDKYGCPIFLRKQRQSGRELGQ